MADVHDTATRSFNMSRIKGKNTKPEMLVCQFLRANGYRYQLHDKNCQPILPKFKYSPAQQIAAVAAQTGEILN